MMTDPIADLLTRIRNAIRIKSSHVLVPKSKVKEGVVKVLQEEGYIHGYQAHEKDGKQFLNIALKYGPKGEAVITDLQRKSRPSLRIYSGKDDLERVQSGFGISVISTSKGVMSDRQCRKNNVGGEILCEVW